MQELASANVDPKAYRLFYKLNAATRIRVRTGCGYSRWEEAGDLLGQGSGGAAKVSALNLDRKIALMFEGGKEMARYGGVTQQPYSFQDDAVAVVEDLEGLRSAVVKMDAVMKMMQVDQNKDKTGYILMGPKHMVKEVRERVKKNPVKCGDWEVKEMEKEKWLGDWFTNGLQESVMATIRDRAPKIRRASFEIVNIVKDYRAQRAGGFLTGLILWESCCIPSLIYNSGCWMAMTKKEEDALSECQDFFLRLLLGRGPGAAKVALRADSGTCSMPMRVKKEKVMLIKHIKELEPESLARLMYEEQINNNWPGLALETEEICKELCIENVNTTVKSKAEYSKDLQKAVRVIDEVRMKKEMGDEHTGMKKMKVMRKSDCSLKDYMKTGTLYSARKTWEVRSYMLRVAGNYPGHKKYLATGWQCQACMQQVREDQDHLVLCSGYRDLLEGKDLESDEDLVDFFRKVMARREKNGWD